MKLRTKYKRTKKELEILKNAIISNKQISDQNLILVEIDESQIDVAGAFYKLVIKLKEIYKDKNIILLPKDTLEIYNLSKEEYDCLSNIISRKNE